MKENRDKARTILIKNQSFVMFVLEDNGDVDVVEHGRHEELKQIAFQVLKGAARFMADPVAEASKPPEPPSEPKKEEVN